MKNLLAAWGVVLFVCLASAPGEAGPAKKAYLIEVSDQKEFMVDVGLASYIRSSLERARDAEVIILEIDTYGGALEAMEEIREAIHDTVLSSKARVVAYIPRKAVSAGAAIAVSCPEIVMREGAHFGDCAPVIPTSEGPKIVDENDKITSVLRKEFETSCRRYGYPYRLGHAMVSQRFSTYVLYEAPGVKIYSFEEFKNLPAAARKKISGGAVPARTEFFFPPELRKKIAEDKADTVELRSLSVPVYVVIDEVFDVDGRRMCFLSRSPDARKDFISLSEAEEDFVTRKLLTQVDSEKELLELSAEQAYAYHFAAKVVSGREDLFSYLGLTPSDVEIVKPSRAVTAVRILNSPIVASLLIMIGVVAVYAELHTPGFGLAGLVALSCFALYFLFSFLARQPHLLPVILFVLGMALLAVEIFLIPGFGVTGIAGILCMIGGLLLVRLPEEFFSGERAWSFDALSEPICVVGGGMLAGFAGCFLIARFLPEMRWFSSHVVTGPSRPVTATESGVTASMRKIDVNVGDEAVVVADLRPSGKIEVNGQRIAALSRGEYIVRGRRVKVVKVQGNRIVVEEA